MTQHFSFKLFIMFLMTSMIGSVFATEIPDPCVGLLALANRPSITGSACVVPYKKMVIEGGYQYLNLSGSSHGYITPQTEFRFGLPSNNEFLISIPNYYHQTVSPRAGWSAPSLSFKHEIGYNADWLGAVEGILTLPTGSEAYGSRAFSGTVDGIVTYAYGPVLSVSATLGVSSISVQYIRNGERFTTVNPNIFATWQLTPKFQLYAELYAQTRTAPDEGAGVLADGGIFYLLTPRVFLDAELGQRVTGQWGFQSYASGGFAVLIG